MLIVFGSILLTIISMVSCLRLFVIKYKYDIHDERCTVSVEVKDYIWTPLIGDLTIRIPSTYQGKKVDAAYFF